MSYIIKYELNYPACSAKVFTEENRPVALQPHVNGLALCLWRMPSLEEIMNRRAKLAATKAEKKQQKLEYGSVSTLFPKVSKITISMKYAKTGVLDPLSRMVNFTRDSAAIFKVSCLCSECPDSGFDFSKIIKTMVKDQKATAKGAISCENCPAPECADVAYTTTIKYL